MKKVKEFESALRAMDTLASVISMAIVIGGVVFISANGSGQFDYTFLIAAASILSGLFFYFIKTLFLGIGYCAIQVAINTEKTGSRV